MTDFLENLIKTNLQFDFTNVVGVTLLIAIINRYCLASRYIFKLLQECIDIGLDKYSVNVY